MDNENEDVQVEQEIVAQEESTEEELDLNLDEGQEEEDDSVSISKSEFSKLKRKAMAYDSTKTAKPAPRVEIGDKDERFERLELRADGYSKDEIDEIMSLGGTKVLDTKLVQSAIKYMRAENKSKNEKEPLSSKSPVYKKFTQEDLSKMSSAEMEKILAE